MRNCVKPTKRHFDSSLNVVHTGTNDLSLEDPPEIIVKRVNAECLKTKRNNVVVSHIIAREDKYKGKCERLSTLIDKVCNGKQITIINHSNITVDQFL